MSTSPPHLRRLLAPALAALLCAAPLRAQDAEAVADDAGAPAEAVVDAPLPPADGPVAAEPAATAGETPSPEDSNPPPAPPPAPAVEAVGPTDLSQNAALHYLSAVALMRIPAAAEDFEVLQVIDRDLPRLPPPALSLHPLAVDWLLSEKGLVAALSRAGEQPECRFPVFRGPGPAMDLEHLGLLRSLAYRALNVVKLYRFVNNVDGAAFISTDLLQMVRHMNQDNTFQSSLAAAGLMQPISLETFRFLGSGLRTEQAEIFTRHFARHREQTLFNPAGQLADEARRLSHWLLEQPRITPQRLALLYGNETQRPAMELLETLPPQPRRDQIQAWLDGYTALTDNIGRGMNRSYAAAYAELVLLEKEIERTAGSRQPGRDNPLPSLMLRGLRARYDRLTLAQAQMDVLEIMAHAARFHGLNGRWPETLRALETFSGVGLPRDRFSGEPYAWSIRRKKPRLIIRIPTSLARDESPVFVYDLAQFQADDEKRLKEYAEQLAKLRTEQQRERVRAGLKR